MEGVRKIEGIAEENTHGYVRVRMHTGGLGAGPLNSHTAIKSHLLYYMHHLPCRHVCQLKAIASSSITHEL